MPSSPSEQSAHERVWLELAEASCLTPDVSAEGSDRAPGAVFAKPGAVPVFVMLPLDSVALDHKVNRREEMEASFRALKSAGVAGVMTDVWWGLVENDRPGCYDWSGYDGLLEMARQHGLKVQAVMSFHRCGGNVGDSCKIPLPEWVVAEIEGNPDMVYTDRWGRRNSEYLSLGCDEVAVLKGRTPIQCYQDFMRDFRNCFSHLLSDTIVEIQVGMGPSGELRYPSYPELNGTWKFPGIGAFQCFDKYMMNSLKATAEAIGRPEWGHGGPTDSGDYNDWPEDTPFFRNEGRWNTPSGEFFLSWYSQMLLNHGERVLSAAEAVFGDLAGVKLSTKISGIHWHYNTPSHAAELTAGYYNTLFRDGYVPIAKMLCRHHAVFNFTCMEMTDSDQPQGAGCSPEGLVRQVVLATRVQDVPLAGENALPRLDEQAYDRIVRVSSLGGFDGDPDPRGVMSAFTYLRMSPQMFEPQNWHRFVAFIKRMGDLSQALKESLHLAPGCVPHDLE